MEQKNKLAWKIDPDHSSIQFKVKHLGIANIAGTFTKFEGTAISESDTFEGAEIILTIAADSVTTNNTQRDEHLKGELFFDVVKHPEISFTGLLEKTGNNYTLSGDITIRGVTKYVQLGTLLTGTGMGRWDDKRAGFELSGKILRRDFGIDLEILTGTGSLVVSEDVNLFMDIELIQQ